jgi:hypothetical protein
MAIPSQRQQPQPGASRLPGVVSSSRSRMRAATIGLSLTSIVFGIFLYSLKKHTAVPGKSQEHDGPRPINLRGGFTRS